MRHKALLLCVPRPEGDPDLAHDAGAAARMFQYWQQQGNMAAAERALAEFRQRKQSRQSPWTSAELLTLARLSESARELIKIVRRFNWDATLAPMRATPVKRRA